MKDNAKDTRYVFMFIVNSDREEEGMVVLFGTTGAILTETRGEENLSTTLFFPFLLRTTNCRMEGRANMSIN